jgi:hypothetical protein
LHLAEEIKECDKKAELGMQLGINKKIYLIIFTIIVMGVFSIGLLACDNANNSKEGKIPTFLGIAAKRVNGNYDTDRVLCVSTVNGVCESIIVEISLINSEKYEISSLKINNKSYKSGGNSESTFSISSEKTIISLTYTPSEVSGEAKVTVTDIYYKTNNDVEIISIFSSNFITLKIDPVFKLTTYVPIDEDYIVDHTRLPEGAVVSDESGINYVSEFDIKFASVPSAIDTFYKVHNMQYQLISGVSFNFCKTAYGFAGWYTEDAGRGDLFNLDEKFTYQNDITLYAFFEPLYTYKISESVESGEYATITGLTKTGQNTSSLTIFYEIDGYKILGIGDNAFKGADNQEIKLNLAISIIGASAFENFTGRITFNPLDETKEDGISDYKKSNIRTIGNRAFANWNYVYGTPVFFIPESVETIGDEAFLGVTWNTATSFISNIPDHTGSLARENTLFIPANVKSIGKQAFKGSKFEYIYFMENSELEDMGEGAFQGTTNLRLLYTSAYLENTQFKKSSNGTYGIKKISNYAFEGSFAGAGKTGTTYEIYLHEGLEEIGENAFFVTFSEKIESIVFPNSLQVIGDRSFANQNKLKNIVFNTDSELTRLGKYAFESSAMEIVRLTSNSFKMYDESPFYGNTVLTTVYIDAIVPPAITVPFFTGLTVGQVKYLVPDVTAYRLKGWTQALMPRLFNVNDISLRDATSGSQFGYEILEDMTVKITYIINQSNQNNEAEYIPSAIIIRDTKGSEVIKTVTEVSNYVTNRNVVTVVLPITLRQINSYAFAGYSKLTNICVGSISNKGFEKLETLENVGESAFNGTNIDKFIAPDSIKYIGRSAFANTANLKTVYINPKNYGCIIFADAFAHSSMEILYLGTRVDYLGDSAFGYCSNLTDIHIYRSYPPNPAPNTNMLFSPFISTINNAGLVIHVRPNSIEAFISVSVYSIKQEHCIDDATTIPSISDL